MQSVVLFLAGLLLVGIPHARMAAKLHNILFIVVDDLTMSTEPYLDPSHPIKQAGINYTPHIKQLAHESTIFHRVYVQNAA